MNLNQLIYASEINRLGSFSRAAQTLFISQSALSKSSHALEVELEQELFIRTTEGAVPTEFGRAFLEEAEQTLRHVNRMREMASSKKKRWKNAASIQRFLWTDAVCQRGICQASRQTSE